MRCLNGPEQKRLFDVFQSLLHPVAYERLRNSWQHLFRNGIQYALNLGPENQTCRGRSDGRLSRALPQTVGHQGDQQLGKTGDRPGLNWNS